MTTGLNDVFALASTPSGEAAAFVSDTVGTFVWQQERAGVVDTLLDAVADLRTFWAERGLDAGVIAARTGVDAVVTHILKGRRFNTARDAANLDAGYYIARYCLPYDFVAMGVVARCGAVAQVERVRFYNQHPDGHAAFLSALDAGLRFTDCVDEDGHNAGFFIARCGDDEIIAKYEAAGGTFRQPELDYLGRARKSAAVA